MPKGTRIRQGIINCTNKRGDTIKKLKYNSYPCNAESPSQHHQLLAHMIDQRNADILAEAILKKAEFHVS